MFDDGSPIYRQIAEEVKASILSGALGEEEQVMSTNRYASFYRINPATAAKAFQQLVEEGILYRKRGIGMFVSAGALERLREQRRSSFAGDLVEPLVREARNLGMSLEEVGSELERAWREGERGDEQRG